MKAAREAAPDRAARDVKIFRELFALPAFTEARRYFLYRSFGAEADTSRIAEELLRRGKEIWYPRVRGREMETVRWTGQPFARGPFGIEEPVGEGEDVRPDVCVLPMLAADKACRRLGYGGGYYDRYLAEAGRFARKVGICYAFQVVDALPAEAHDIPADLIVTDAGVLARGGAGDNKTSASGRAVWRGEENRQ